MNSDNKDNTFWLAESTSTVRTLDDGDTRKSVYSRAQNSSFLKLKRLVLVQIVDACRLGAFVFFIFGLVSAGTICVAIGILNLRHCPLQKYIPVYLIAEGALMLIALPHVVLAGDHRPVTPYTDFVSLAYKACLIACEICILFMGTVAVYSVVPPNFDPSDGPHCSKICYLSAFFVVTATWLFALVLIILAASLMCCSLFYNTDPGNNARPPTPV